MSYEVSILADSLHPTEDVRLTTFEVTFPRFILAEVNTHRTFSRNSASSRAIPIHKQIAKIREEPFVPLGFGSAQPGMQSGENLKGWKAKFARQIWLKSRYPAIWAATCLDKLNVHKQFANRLLEPWMWHTAIITSTEWDNFWALRTNEGAQPEFRHIASMMLKAYKSGKPTILNYDEDHLPLITDEDRELHNHNRNKLRQIAVGRLARRSSYNRSDPEPDGKSIERAMMLSTNGHWSPFEHVAWPIRFDWTLHPSHFYSGNFKGFHQYRKQFPYENDFSQLKESL